MGTGLGKGDGGVLSLQTETEEEGQQATGVLVRKKAVGRELSGGGGMFKPGVQVAEKR